MFDSTSLYIKHLISLFNRNSDKIKSYVWYGQNISSNPQKINATEFHYLAFKYTFTCKAFIQIKLILKIFLLKYLHFPLEYNLHV